MCASNVNIPNLQLIASEGGLLINCAVRNVSLSNLFTVYNLATKSTLIWHKNNNEMWRFEEATDWRPQSGVDDCRERRRLIYTSRNTKTRREGAATRNTVTQLHQGVQQRRDDVRMFSTQRSRSMLQLRTRLHETAAREVRWLETASQKLRCQTKITAVTNSWYLSPKSVLYEKVSH